jgi:ubiquinone biosynthesis protein UbiJ
VSDFLSDQWFEDLNARLYTSAPMALPENATACQVVFDVVQGPASLPHALTLSISNEGARVTPGDALAADTVVRLSYDDAAALTSGRLDSASALRDGRIKVRGDVNVLVPLAIWLRAVLAD